MAGEADRERVKNCGGRGAGAELANFIAGIAGGHSGRWLTMRGYT